MSSWEKVSQKASLGKHVLRVVLSYWVCRRTRPGIGWDARSPGSHLRSKWMASFPLGTTPKLIMRRQIEREWGNALRPLCLLSWTASPGGRLDDTDNSGSADCPNRMVRCKSKALRLHRSPKITLPLLGRLSAVLPSCQDRSRPAREGERQSFARTGEGAATRLRFTGPHATPDASQKDQNRDHCAKA